MRGRHLPILWPLGAIALALPAAAHADLVLSELIVELQPGKVARDDVEVWNNSPERTYVAVEPREIINPSLPSQSDRKDPDPEKLGLLVEPAKMILDPGQRRLVRIAALPGNTEHEHVYRVTIKPVLGPVRSENSGLRSSSDMTCLSWCARRFHKRTSWPIALGGSSRSTMPETSALRWSTRRQCVNLFAMQRSSGKRLYPGASWMVDLPSDGAAEYTLKSPGRSERVTY